MTDAEKYAEIEALVTEAQKSRSNRVRREAWDEIVKIIAADNRPRGRLSAAMIFTISSHASRRTRLLRDFCASVTRASISAYFSASVMWHSAFLAVPERPAPLGVYVEACQAQWWCSACGRCQW